MSGDEQTRHMVLVSSGLFGSRFIDPYYSPELSRQAILEVLLPKRLWPGVDVLARPTAAWVPEAYLQGRDIALNVVLGIPCNKVRSIAAELSQRDGIVGFGTDEPIDGFLHWCPSGENGGIFRDSDAALEVSGLKALHDAGHTGKGVNVIVVDKGIDHSKLPLPGACKGGWEKGAGGSTYKPCPQLSALLPNIAAHGTMIAQVVHLAAPEASIWDLRALVHPIATPCFLSETEAAYARVKAAIDKGELSGPCIFINAWGIWTTRTDPCPGSAPYSTAPGHPFTKGIEALGDQFDIVFAAGNCGSSCPDARCGPADRGPGRSIHGANGTAAVTSVGAARIDDIWLGLSAEGKSALGYEKPDFCAPSHFRNSQNHLQRYTGTSAAAALTAGAIACLRSKNSNWQGKKPHELRVHLRAKTRGIPTGGWNSRLGAGFLNAVV